MRKPEPKGRTLESESPLRMAPIACSRIPKCRFRPAGLVSLKSPAPSNVSRVLHDGERSADPPITHGTVRATAFKTTPEVSLLALPLESGGKAGRSWSQP